MTNREIARVAKITARKCRRGLNKCNIKLDDASESIICEYVQTELTNWQRENKYVPEMSIQFIQEILSRRLNETTVPYETAETLKLIFANLPALFDKIQRERESEAKELAAKLPAIKV